MEYRIEQNGNKIIVWDDINGVGLRFTHGDTLQRYTSELILRDVSETDDILNCKGKPLSEISDNLTEYAAGRYPYEFEEIKY